MTPVTEEFKLKVLEKLLERRERFDGNDGQFAKSLGLRNDLYSTLTGNYQKGKGFEGLLRDHRWMDLGFELDVQINERKWNMARTDVFSIIEEDILFCKNHAKSRVFVDDCGIGKTYSAKYLARTLNNCFYIDASQAKRKNQFIRLLAKTIGMDDKGAYVKVKERIKYALRNLPHPIVIIDEAGDLDYNAFLELKEFWNATEYRCGWYMMGADGLRKKIDSGLARQTNGFAEIFSRYSENYSNAVPKNNKDKQAFYRQLISTVLKVNMEDVSKLNQIVNKCIVNNEYGQCYGLRRAESLLILNS